MTRKPPVPPSNDDADEPDEHDISTIITRREHEQWPAGIKEQAAALIFSGLSIRAAARRLSVPPSTLRAWKLSADPLAQELRQEKMAQIIDAAWSGAEVMIEKTITAPVFNAQQASVSAGILIERALMMEARQEAAQGVGKTGTVMDLVNLYAQHVAQQQAEREAEQSMKARVLAPRPERPAIKPPA